MVAEGTLLERLEGGGARVQPWPPHARQAQQAAHSEEVLGALAEAPSLCYAGPCPSSTTLVKCCRAAQQ